MNLQYIYILTDGQYYKIGYAQDVQARIRKLQTGNPARLTLVHQIECDRPAVEVERRIHAMFAMNKVKRMRGEWFKLTDAHIEFIKEYQNSKELY